MRFLRKKEEEVPYQKGQKGQNDAKRLFDVTESSSSSSTSESESQSRLYVVSPIENPHLHTAIAEAFLLDIDVSGRNQPPLTHVPGQYTSSEAFLRGIRLGGPMHVVAEDTVVPPLSVAVPQVTHSPVDSVDSGESAVHDVVLDKAETGALRLSPRKSSNRVAATPVRMVVRGLVAKRSRHRIHFCDASRRAVMMTFAVLPPPREEDSTHQDLLHEIVAVATRSKETRFGALVDESDIEALSPTFFDDPTLTTGKHRVVMKLAGLSTTVLPFVRPGQLKSELNATFARRHASMGITLTQLRKSKHKMLLATYRSGFDPSTVSLSYVYLERLLAKRYFSDKSGMQLTAAACLALAAKFHDPKALDKKEYKLLMENVRQIMGVSIKDVHHAEFKVWLALDAALFVQDGGASHLVRVMEDWTVVEDRFHIQQATTRKKRFGIV